MQCAWRRAKGLRRHVNELISGVNFTCSARKGLSRPASVPLNSIESRQLRRPSKAGASCSSKEPQRDGDSKKVISLRAFADKIMRRRKSWSAFRFGMDRLSRCDRDARNENPPAASDLSEVANTHRARGNDLPRGRHAAPEKSCCIRSSSRPASANPVEQSRATKGERLTGYGHRLDAST